ncbi:MAG TPA: hypothetical protein VFU37_22710 [Pyrinomonadaceae bacterium]|nr:hypothetical protein [Pyrinomonadaceae bacterium]
MRFEITPEEAQPLALAVIKHLGKTNMKIRIEEAAWEAAPYRTTIVAEKGGRKLLIEAQGELSYGRSQRDLAAWLAANRHYAEFYIAVSTDADSGVEALHAMKTDGVGLWIVNDQGAVTEHHRARNPALVVTPDPTLSFGPLKARVREALQKFNDMDRKDGLRDMCEIVEHLTEEVGVAACKKGRLKIPEEPFRDKDWASQINELARTEAYISPHTPIVNTRLKDDLHSFRGARNLFDHPAKSHTDNKKRQMQFAERMIQGPRLLAELLSLKRRIK